MEQLCVTSTSEHLHMQGTHWQMFDEGAEVMTFSWRNIDCIDALQPSKNTLVEWFVYQPVLSEKNKC